MSHAVLTGTASMTASLALTVMSDTYNAPLAIYDDTGGYDAGTDSTPSDMFAGVAATATMTRS